MKKETVVYECDRCHRDDLPADFIKRSGSVLTLSRHEGKKTTHENMDLCDKCTADLVLFMQGWDVHSQTVRTDG